MEGIFICLLLLSAFISWPLEAKIQHHDWSHTKRNSTNSKGCRRNSFRDLTIGKPYLLIVGTMLDESLKT